MTIISDPWKIEMMRLKTLRAALKLEMSGMRHSSGVSAYSRIKREFGFKGNKESVYKQFSQYILDNELKETND